MSLDPILSLDGRVGRRTYLVFLLGAFAVWYGLGFVGMRAATWLPRSAFPDLADLPKMSRATGFIVGIPTFCVAIVLFFVSISFGVRRFHDMSLSGDWNWLAVLVALVPLPSLAGLAGLPQAVLPATPFLLWHAFLLLRPGSPGRNRFGAKGGAGGDDDIAAIFDEPASGPR